jgi:predicted NAD/FAD-dependent oxidoreductase
MEKAYDIIVAGGGAAGVLAAARLATANPKLKIIVLEKEAHLGGRLKSTTATERTYGYGLNAVSDQLFEFWSETLKQAGTDVNLSELVPDRQKSVGILAGNKLNHSDVDLWFSAKGARLLGGYTASRQWPEIEEILQKHAGSLDDDDEGDDSVSFDEDAPASTPKKDASARAGASHAFSHFWNKPRKAPAAVVLDHYSSAFGIPDVWSAAPSAIAQRAAFHAGGLHSGNWLPAFDALQNIDVVKDSVTFETNCRIAKAEKKDDKWHVTSGSGTFTATKLIIAQSPWQAAFWLPRAYWPAHLLSLANKTKPVSVVVLSEQLKKSDIEIPDVIIVPAEKVQIIRNGERDLCFQATIDYEMSLQAPAVVKAVKALKRARKKLQLLFPDAVSDTDHFALQPIAWAQSPIFSEKRNIDKMRKKGTTAVDIAFVGDAYGANFDGDSNIISSIQAAISEAVAD